MSERHRLPNRRPCVSYDIVVRGQPYVATIGYDPGTGRPLELFLFGAKTGSDMQFALDDAAVTISIAAQLGLDASAVVRSISRLPSPIDDVPREPATVLGLALDLFAAAQAAAIEGELV